MYEEVRHHPMSGGRVAKVFACLGLRPEALRGARRMNMDIKFGAYPRGDTCDSVSALNCCHYRSTLFPRRVSARMESGERTLVRHLKTDPENAPLEAQDHAMIDFALKLTRAPATVKREDREFLHRYGFSEENAVDIALITCVFNFMNRLADGLGVALAPQMQYLLDVSAD